MKSSKIALANIIILLIALITASCSMFGKKEETNLNTAEAVIEQGDALYEQGKYEEALKMYKSMLIDFPTSDLHIDAQLRIADTYGKLDKYEDQMDVLLRLLRENIIPDRVPEVYCQIGEFYEKAALFNPGMVSSDTADYNTALDYYKKAIEYTDSEDQLSKSKAQYRSALVNAKLGRIQKAIDEYNLVISKYPNSPYATLAKMKLKSPDNTAELSLSEEAMKSYAEILGEQIPSDTDVMEPQEAPQTEPENDMLNQNESNMLDNSEDMNTQDNSIEETPAEETSQETPLEEAPQETSPENQEAAGDTTTVNE